MKVEFKDGNESKTDYVQLVDFTTVSNNQFLVVNQYTLAGTKGNRRPDVIVFINGLSLAVIELKNPADSSADIWSASNYKRIKMKCLTCLCLTKPLLLAME